MNPSAADNGTPRQGRASGAETARKALRVLLHFSVRTPTASVKELAAACDLPLVTTHRYVALLKELGLIEEAGRAQYRLGWRAAQLGHAATEAGSIVSIAEPVMQRLADETDETVTLFQRADLEMECIAQVESAHVIRLTFEPGQRLKLSSGASARVLLSAVPDDELTQTLDAFEKRDPTFHERRATFEEGIRQTRERGWATSREEIDQGVWAIAAPVSLGRHTVASLAVAGPLLRQNPDTEQRVTTLLRAATETLNDRLESRQTS